MSDPVKIYCKSTLPFNKDSYFAPCKFKNVSLFRYDGSQSSNFDLDAFTALIV